MILTWGEAEQRVDDYTIRAAVRLPFIIYSAIHNGNVS